MEPPIILATIILNDTPYKPTNMAQHLSKSDNICQNTIVRRNTNNIYFKKELSIHPYLVKVVLVDVKAQE